MKEKTVNQSILSMEIRYERTKTGLLTTPCPYDVFRQRMVGSKRCQRCSHNAEFDKNNRIVKCKHP